MIPDKPDAPSSNPLPIHDKVKMRTSSQDIDSKIPDLQNLLSEEKTLSVFRRKLNSKNANLSEFTEHATLPKKVIFALLVEPKTEFTAKNVYNFGREILEIPDNKQLQPEIKCSIAIRTIAAAAQISSIKELYSSKIIQNLSSKQPKMFGLPHLMLCAYAVQPIDSNLPEPEHLRQRILFTFYRGINYLFLKKYSKAKLDFIHVITMEDSHTDVLNETYKYLSLTCFLIGDSWAVFKHYLEQRHCVLLTGDAKNIWNVDFPIDHYGLSPPFRLFADDIIRQHSKRVLIDYAQTCTSVPLKDIKENTPYFDWALQKINEENEYSIVVEKDVVFFKELDLSKTIEQEAAHLTHLRKLMLGNSADPVNV